MKRLMRHVAACHSARLPGRRLVFRLAGVAVGFVSPALAAALSGRPGVMRHADALDLDRAAALPGLVRALAEEGWWQLRDEAFDIRADLAGPVLGQIDRGAVPAFGILAQGVHLHGLVRRADGLHLWVARRALSKAVDPGKLDHLVAGGMPAGLTAAETLAKEAAEEAAIPPAVIVRAAPAACLRYAMAVPEGVRRDVLHCYDLDLPEDFVPVAQDGEVAGFELWPIDAVLARVRDTDDFKFNVNLALIDLFLRRGMLDATAAAHLRVTLDRPVG